MHSDMGKKLVANFAQRVAPKGGTDEVRPDLYLADYEKTGRASAKLLVAWAPAMEPPSVEALDNWVLAQWQGNFRSEMATVRTFPKEHVSTVIVSQFLPVRRIEDTTAMLKVSPVRYMEASTKHVWEVREGEEGKHLVRVQEDNMEELLEERRKSIRGRKGNVPTFASVRSAGNLVVDLGDTVKFYVQGLLKEGKVLEVKGEEVTVAAGAKKHRVTVAAVVDVVTKDPTTVTDQKERVRAYWEKILGKEYVDKWLGQA